MIDLNAYMEEGIKNIAKRTVKYYVRSINGRRFLVSFIPQLEKSSLLRAEYEKQGLHVPRFLICSITSQCNLHCKGCYARASGACSDALPSQMTAETWKKVFAEAAELGISFVMLAGGEPLLRRDVLDAAAEFKSIAFPVFTNSTLLDVNYINFFDKHRNMIPVISIEGDAAATDIRRGEGVAQKVSKAISDLKKLNILFAVSITVTSENMMSVTEPEYAETLHESGCGLIFYVEYVPAQAGTEKLALGENEAEQLNSRVDALREQYHDMSVFSFPGDEANMNGCLAAGRGFFHINSAGGAEPCPFSPYSKLNVQKNSLKEILASDFFKTVREISAAETDHNGGCTLFRFESVIKNL